MRQMPDHFVDGVTLVISYRFAITYIHADYLLYKDGKLIGTKRSNSACSYDLNPGSFCMGKFMRYITSEDKKHLRNFLGFEENCPTPEEITDERGLILYKRRFGDFDWARVVSVKAIPITVCPTCATEGYHRLDNVTRESYDSIPENLFDVLYQYRRCEDCMKLKYRERGALNITAFASWSNSPRPWRLRSALDEGKDPRSFLYEKKSKIPKETITKKVVGHIKKVLKIRPLSNSERDFFRLIIGARKLTQLA